MAATAGYQGKIYVSTNDSAYTEVGGINSIDFNYGYEAADISQMGDVAARKLPTIVSFSGSASGVRDVADGGQVAVMGAITTPALLWVKVLPNGSTGYKCQCAIKPVKIGNRWGAEATTFGFDFEAAGGAAPAAV